MATGSQTFESLRGAIESSEGAGTTPTRLLYVPQGGIELRQGKEPIRVELAWNKRDAVNDILSGIEDVSVAVTDVPISFQDLHWWLSMFDANGLSAAPVNSDTTAYTRTGAPSQTDSTVSATGVKSAHLQYSASDFIGTRGWSVPGLVGEELSVTFNKRASGADTGCRFSATFRTASQATAITAFTGSLSDRTQTWALGNLLASSIDTTTIGSTADTNITTATFTLRVPAVFHDGMDGTAAHTTMHRPMPWETSLTYQRKFSNTTELDAYLGTTFGVKTLRKFYIQAVGPLAGASTVFNTVQFRFTGKYEEKDPAPVRVDGMWYENFTMRGVYDSATQVASWKFVTINNVATAATTL